MMPPEPFTFEAGSRAVLLLHAFTGNSADVRMLGRFLQKKGYTSHSPIYRGHGVEPEKLIASGPDEWWEDVVEAYEYLQFLGYEEIAIAGLSIVGVLGLKLASERPVKGVIPMCTPMYFDNEQQLTKGFRQFARQYKQFQKKDEQTIEKEVAVLMEDSIDLFQRTGTFVEEVNGLIDLVYSPALIIQATHDEMINPESANFIYEHLAVDDKEKTLKWYEESGHFITVGNEKDMLHDDIYTFLEGLNWEE
jgi:carboxylesterase